MDDAQSKRAIERIDECYLVVSFIAEERFVFHPKKRIN